MTKTAYVITVFLICTGFVIISCSDNESSVKPDGKHGKHSGDVNSSEYEHNREHSEYEVVSLTEKQMDTAGIIVSQVQKMPLRNTVKSRGFLELPPQNKADVSTVIAGQIKNIYVREGDKVNSGEIIAELVDPEYSELQADYRKSASKAEYLEKEYIRKKNLYEENIGSKRQLEKVRSEYESVVAERLSLESKLKMLGLEPRRILEGKTYGSIPVKAPIDGYVRVIKANTGEHAGKNEELFEIVDNAHIHIDFMVYEKDIHRIKVDQEVLFKYTNQPGKDFYKARIFSVGKAFENDPRMVRIHAEPVDHEEIFLPGMFVEGQIITGSEMLQVLPEEAVVNDSGKYIVFMLKQDIHDSGHEHKHEENHSAEFIPVMVKTGISEAGFTQVDFFDELPHDAKFVTSGAYYLLAEMKKGEGGHSH